MIEVKNLTFRYGTEPPILDSWSETFRDGEMVAVTGASGRGKSTLLYILGLMLRPVAGEVLLHGRAVQQLRDRDRASLRAHEYGFVFQDASLDPTRTVLDNVIEGALYRSEPRSQAAARATVLLEYFGVAVRSDAKPGQVSGGQAHRIALCRALMNRPSVLLADEPTGNLDPLSSSLVLRALRAHADDGNVVVVVTHDPEVVQWCSREVRL